VEFRQPNRDDPNNSEPSMRRRDRLVEDRKQIDAIIRGSDVCRLALAKDNMPYVVPLSFGYDGEAIYIHTARSGKKIEYFEANDKVCFEFETHVELVRDDGDACEWGFSFESAIGYGTIVELVDRKQVSYALEQITKQYGGSQSEFDKGSTKNLRAWKITVDSVEGKKTTGKEAS